MNTPQNDNARLVRMATAAGLINLKPSRIEVRPVKPKLPPKPKTPEQKARDRECGRRHYHQKAALYRKRGLTVIGTKPKNKKHPELAHLDSTSLEYRREWTRAKRSTQTAQG